MSTVPSSFWLALSVAFAQARASLALSFAYRIEFIADAFVELLDTVAALVPLVVIYGERPALAGWSFGEALMVTGCFIALQGIVQAFISPSLMLLVEQVRKGTFDFALLKPVDSQLLASTSRFAPLRAVNVVAGVACFIVGFGRLGRSPPAFDIASFLLLFSCAIAILYSLWLMTASLAFWVVKLDNMTFLLMALFDTARWPASVFRRPLRIALTFVLPLAVMTTFPAEALLGRATMATFISAIGVTLAFAVLSRIVWMRSLARYTSASS